MKEYGALFQRVERSPSSTCRGLGRSTLTLVRSPRQAPPHVSSLQRILRSPAVIPTSFPFMRLPLEIRIRICQMLLSRLYPGRHSSLPPAESGVEFKVSDSPFVPGWLEGFLHSDD